MSEYIGGGTIKRLHVNQASLRSAVKRGDLKSPVCLVKVGKKSVPCREVKILDDCGHEIATLRQSLDKPLSCGARVWVETTADIVVLT